MKRFLVIAMMVMIGNGALFAQSVSLSGYFNSGIGVVFSDEDDVDPKLGAFGVDSEQLGYRFRLNGSVQNEERTAGFRFRLQSQNALDRRSNEYLSLPFAYGFMNFFESKLGFSAGIVDDSTWQTADFWIADDVGEGLGVLLKSINLINGLNLGFGAYLISQEGGGRNNQFSKDLNSDHLLDISDAKYVISGSYTLANVFYLGGSFRLTNDAGDNILDNKNQEEPIPLGRQETSQLIGDLRVLAVPNLTAVLAFSIDNLQDFDEEGIMTFSETFAYKFNDVLNIGLNAVQFLSNKNDTDMSMLFNIWGSFAFGSFVPRLDLTYFLGGNINPTHYHHRKGYSPNYNIDYTVLSVRPSVRINLDSRTHFEIGNVTHLSNNDKSSMLNLPYIDFRWSF